MLNDKELTLEKVYLSMSKSLPTVPSDEHDDDLHDETTATIHADEPESSIEDVLMSDEPEHEDTSCGCSDCNCSPECSCNQTSTIDLSKPPTSSEECEEEDMVIDNLNSIRESIMKISSYCATGGHLEIWQQQKLAIAMDNLAEVARRVKSPMAW